MRQLLLSATQDASVAMSRWTDGLICLALEEVCEIPLERVCEELNICDQTLVMVVLSLRPPLAGELILNFDEPNARQLAYLLAGCEPNLGGEWSELERSALMETGNILGCAYVNALSRLIDRELIPTAPYFVCDFGASVLQQALIVQAMHSNSAVVARTGFFREETRLAWHVLFLPSPALQKAMEAALHSHMSRWGKGRSNTFGATENPRHDRPCSTTPIGQETCD